MNAKQQIENKLNDFLNTIPADKVTTYGAKKGQTFHSIATDYANETIAKLDSHGLRNEKMIGDFQNRIVSDFESTMNGMMRRASN